MFVFFFYFWLVSSSVLLRFFICSLSRSRRLCSSCASLSSPRHTRGDYFFVFNCFWCCITSLLPPLCALQKAKMKSCCCSVVMMSVLCSSTIGSYAVVSTSFIGFFLERCLQFHGSYKCARSFFAGSDSFGNHHDIAHSFETRRRGLQRLFV